jgi:hypothetical protein
MFTNSGSGCDVLKELLNGFAGLVCDFMGAITKFALEFVNNKTKI